MPNLLTVLLLEALAVQEIAYRGNFRKQGVN